MKSCSTLSRADIFEIFIYFKAWKLNTVYFEDYFDLFTEHVSFYVYYERIIKYNITNKESLLVFNLFSLELPVDQVGECDVADGQRPFCTADIWRDRFRRSRSSDKPRGSLRLASDADAFWSRLSNY